VELQTLAAIAIAAAAALWLAWRWWKRGFDDDTHGCSGCSAAEPTKVKSPRLTRGTPPAERPVAKDARSARGG
jgi:hypothetical protein